MPTVCSLEEFSLTKLHLDFHQPEADEAVITQAKCGFDYAVATHSVEKNRYRLGFRVRCCEADEGGKHMGNAMEAEIVGFFRFDEDESKEKMDALIRLNGVSILYGILRGIVATVTGVFPTGKFLLPTVMPREIVEHAEKAKPKNAHPKSRQTKGKRKLEPAKAR